MFRVQNQTLPLSALLLTSSLFAPPAGAGGHILEEILVTAALRTDQLLNESSSISVVGNEQIVLRSASHVEEVLNLAANVNSSSGASRGRFFQIRGVGERSQFQAPVNPSIGLLVDDTDYSGLGGAAILFDIDQVEILRGPQGTLHGANALGGLINIRSSAPTATPYHSVDVSLAEYNGSRFGLVSSGPLGNERLLYRLAAHNQHSDGYIDNSHLAREDTNNRDESALRLRLSWQTNESSQLGLKLQHTNINNGYDAFSLDNTRETLSDQPGRDNLESNALGLSWQYSGAQLESESRISLARTETDYAYDEDWSFVGIHPGEYSSWDRYLRERDSLSAEIRLLSTDQSRLLGDRSDWVAGAYYLANREDLLRQYTYLPAEFNSAYDSDTYALFGQLDTSLGSHWTLVTGLRVERRKTSYRDNRNVSFEPDKTLWGGRVAFEYQANPSQLWYASVSRGYRANGINAEILASLDAAAFPESTELLTARQTYDEEYLLNYELGFKSRFADGRAEFSAAVFYMDRNDQQVKGSLVVARDQSGSSFIDYTSNAAEGSNYGAELALRWIPRENLDIYANLGLLETEFDNYVNAFGEDLSGREQAQSPNYHYSVGGRWHIAGGFYMSLAIEGKDDYFFSDRHRVKSPSYNLLHLRTGYQGEKWSLALWARNLTDRDYYVRGFGSFGNDPRKFYITEPYLQYGEPRVAGISASFLF